MSKIMSLFLLFISTLLVESHLLAQERPQLTNETNTLSKDGLFFKAVKITSPQQETFEVLSLGTPIFTVSNIADGSWESYSHNLRVAYPLQIGGGRTGFQLIFYGLNDKIPYAVAQEGNITSVYVPYSVHDQLKGKIEQTLAARKKVQLKINLLPSGLREAIWVIN